MTIRLYQSIKKSVNFAPLERNTIGMTQRGNFSVKNVIKGGFVATKKKDSAQAAVLDMSPDQVTLREHSSTSKERLRALSVQLESF
jgi:hypothetical protein